MANDKVAARKVAIAPITFVIDVVADRVSEKGTFSGLKIKDVKSTVKELQGKVKVSIPPAGGGAMYIRTEVLNGVKVLGEIDKVAPKKEIKLF